MRKYLRMGEVLTVRFPGDAEDLQLRVEGSDSDGEPLLEISEGADAWDRGDALWFTPNQLLALGQAVMAHLRPDISAMEHAEIAQGAEVVSDG